MSSSLTHPNTSPTPGQAGRWIVTKFGPPSVLKWETWDPTQDLADDKVLVRIIVSGIAGVDNIQRAGGYPDPRAHQPGITTGYDFVGEVVALADGVPGTSNLTVGDQVVSLCVLGAHATHIVLPHDYLIKLEPNDDPLKISALPLNYMTSWGMLKHSDVNLTPGSSILIGSASGGLGTAVAQLVTAFNMGIKMYGTCSPNKFDYVRSLGVEPIDRNAPDLVEQVRKLTNGEGVDVAYDGVCSEKSIADSLACTKADVGQVIIFGVMDGISADGNGMQKSGHEILAERLKSPRVRFWHLDIEFYKKPEIAEFLAMVNKVRKGELNPVIFKVLRLEQAVEAHELLINGSMVKGKMMFVVDGDLAKEHGL